MIIDRMFAKPLALMRQKSPEQPILLLKLKAKHKTPRSECTRGVWCVAMSQNHLNQNTNGIMRARDNPRLPIAKNTTRLEIRQVETTKRNATWKSAHTSKSTTHTCKKARDKTSIRWMLGLQQLRVSAAFRGLRALQGHQECRADRLSVPLRSMTMMSCPCRWVSLRHPRPPRL